MARAASDISVETVPESREVMGTSTAMARLFYDPGCGPCTMFARVSEWASRSRLRALPYDGPEATRTLGDLGDDVRFAYAHLVDARGRWSGAEIMNPLVTLTLGRAGGRVAAKVPPIDRGLRWLYDRFWSYRQAHGCGTQGSVPRSGSEAG